MGKNVQTKAEGREKKSEKKSRVNIGHVLSGFTASLAHLFQEPSFRMVTCKAIPLSAVDGAPRHARCTKVLRVVRGEDRILSK
jgi:hypothetical protein